MSKFNFLTQISISFNTGFIVTSIIVDSSNTNLKLYNVRVQFTSLKLLLKKENCFDDSTCYTLQQIIKLSIKQIQFDVGS